MRLTLPRAVRIAAVLLALAVLAGGCASSDDGGVPELERRAAALNKAVMCPVCPGESIDQSQNPLSVQMRGIVEEKLAEGWSEREIKDFFVERYGPSVLLEPPTEGFSLAAWIVPPLAFALAIASLLLTLRWMRRSSEARAQAEGEARDAEHTRYVRRLESVVGTSDDPSGGERPHGVEDR